jgi:ATP-dependent metalloprotease FtsH
MNILDRILFFVIGISILGTITTSFFSEDSNLHVIGFQEMKQLNISKINIVNKDAYLYISNSTHNDILSYKYAIGNTDLFNTYLQNATNNNIDIEYTEKVNIYKSLLYNLPSILFLYVMIKSLSNQSDMFSGAFSRNLNKTVKTDTKFDDIAGLKEVKEDIREFVDILKGVDKFKKMKCKIPRGALFYGPPGTGKTLIAKALANECNTNFMHVSGSSFNEVFVGVGQSRVRKLFEKARNSKPCIIFIDEIDTLGKRRSKYSEGHNEHENTLNSLLAEMDGMDSNDDILIFGATNRPNMLDSALTRPGRFDRKIEFNLPNLEERKEIIKLYLQKYPLKGDINQISNEVANNTFQFSGADLSNLCNEAAIKSVRNNKEEIDLEEMNNAIDYILVGSKRESSKLDSLDKKTVAYHESGHAFMSYIQNLVESPCKISIIPTTKGALGFSMSNNKEKKLQSKNELFQQMAVMLGGRCSESIFMDDITTGASDDLDKLRKLARMYISYYGMSDKFRNMNVNDEDLSDKTKQIIDTEILNLVNEVEKYVSDTLDKNKESIHKMAKVLLKKEELTGVELKRILGKTLESSLESSINLR